MDGLNCRCGELQFPIVAPNRAPLRLSWCRSESSREKPQQRHRCDRSPHARRGLLRHAEWCRRAPRLGRGPRLRRAPRLRHRRPACLPDAAVCEAQPVRAARHGALTVRASAVVSRFTSSLPDRFLAQSDEWVSQYRVLHRGCSHVKCDLTFGESIAKGGSHMIPRRAAVIVGFIVALGLITTGAGEPAAGRCGPGCLHRVQSPSLEADSSRRPTGTAPRP